MQDIRRLILINFSFSTVFLLFSNISYFILQILFYFAFWKQRKINTSKLLLNLHAIFLKCVHKSNCMYYNLSEFSRVEEVPLDSLLRVAPEFVASVTTLSLSVLQPPPLNH